MGGGRRSGHRGRDLDDRGEIAELVTRFYRELAQDSRFHHYFHTVAAVDWPTHTRRMTDFWAGALLGGPADRRSAAEVIEAHVRLHRAEPFDRELFDRWLEIFDSTLDEGWTGPMTEAARRLGHGFVRAMAGRFIGDGLRRPV